LDGTENLSFSGIGSPDGPAHSEWLFSLSYPSCANFNIILLFFLSLDFPSVHAFFEMNTGKKADLYILRFSEDILKGHCISTAQYYVLC
jgi:hypothetical protein